MPDSNNDWSKKYLDDLNDKLKKSANDQKNKPVPTPNTQKNIPAQHAAGQKKPFVQKNVQKTPVKTGNPKNFQDNRSKQKPIDRKFDNKKSTVEQKKNFVQKPKSPLAPAPTAKPVKQKNGYVSSLDGKEYWVAAEDKSYRCSVMEAVLRMGPIYVGDRVRVVIQSEDRGVIDRYEPRQNAVAAPWMKNQKQEIVQAANINQIMLVVSVKEPVLRTDWLDRHLVVCERKGFKPILCCTKIDLADDNMFLEQMEVYKRLGYRVLFTSSASAMISGIHEIKMMLRNKSTLFTGHLGVGKSTLIDMLTETDQITFPEEPEDYEAVIVDDYVETKKTVCIPFEGKGLLVDTPGIAEYELTGILRKDLKKYFREFRSAQVQCFSPDCLHTNEPGCKIIEAVQRMEIAEDRYQNYLQMLEGL